MLTGFHCINISSLNPKALVLFYSEILGVPIIDGGYGDYDGARLGFIPDAPSICVWDENKWGAYEGKPTFVFMCDCLDKTYNELRAKGLVIEPPFTASWGGRELCLKDPDGNSIMLLEG